MQWSTLGEGVELRHGTVVDVLVTGKGAGIRVLPDRVAGPARGQRADTGAVARDPQRIGAETVVVARALPPPTRRCVNRRIDPDVRLHLVDERPDPPGQ